MAQEVNFKKKRIDPMRRRHSGMLLLPLAVMALAIVAAVNLKAGTAPVDPQIPKENRYTGDRVFLERADRLFTLPGDSFQILVGDVVFRKQDMFMYCDSAHFYPDNSMKAYGNVRMEQGDTLFVFADSLWYDNLLELATLYAYPENKVRLINKDVELETDEFYYDMAIELGYYEVGGVLTDRDNRLVSLMGEYSPSTKDANFYTDVHLTSLRDGDTLEIFTDTLNYNTLTHVAVLTCFSRIVNKDGVIFTSEGTYNTSTDMGELYDRSLVVMKRGNTLTGDTLFYDRSKGFGEAFGNMILTDSVRQSTLMGDYGFYNELTDSAFVTGHALALEYSRKDTLYLHGDTIRAFKVYLPEEQINDTTWMAADSTHYIIANPRVRFYRVDMQGICDSMTFIQIDSTLYMNRHPVVWTDNRQIFGNEIQVHLNDSTVDRATLPNQAFSAEMIEEGYFDQLSGREMVAYIDDGELRHLDVSGNVEAISFPMENDSTYNKVVAMESSYLSADFANQTVERMKIWPEVKTVITPLYLAKRSIFYLPRFRWLDVLRPIDPEDVFYIPPEMIEYLAQPEEEAIRGKDQTSLVDKNAIPPGRRVIAKPEAAAEEPTLDQESGLTEGADTQPMDSITMQQPETTVPDSAVEETVDSLGNVISTVPDAIELDTIKALNDSIAPLTGGASQIDSLRTALPAVIDSLKVNKDVATDSLKIALPTDSIITTPIPPQ